jgi:hypothetical protein
MTDEQLETTAYSTIDAAELAIIAAGYYRNKARCVWEHANTRTCVKVVRDVASGKFIVQSA